MEDVPCLVENQSCAKGTTECKKNMALINLGNKFYHKFTPQEGVVTMTKVKVQNNGQQVKLVFCDLPERDFDVDRLTLIQ
jgi:hypothetical protein